MEPIRKEAKKREDFRTYEYLIVFVERPGRNWWDYFFRTRLGFRHCYVLQRCEWSQRWIMVDWRLSRTDMVIMFDLEVEFFLEGIGAVNGTAVKYIAPKQPDELVGPITYCSNITARFLGLGNPVILTPFGLYRRLLKSGGEVVFSWRDDHGQL